MTSRHHRRGILVLAVLALALGACSGDDSTDTSTGKTEGNESPAADEVVMRLIAFRPEALTVPAGTKVTWKQTDAGFHTVTDRKSVV